MGEDLLVGALKQAELDHFVVVEPELSSEILTLCEILFFHEIRKAVDLNLDVAF